MQDSEATQPPLPSPGDEPRLAFLLHLLSIAPERRLTRGELNRKLQTRAAEMVGLNPAELDQLLSKCQGQGHVQTQPAPRTVRYSLTDAGQSQLATLEMHLPAASARSSRGKMCRPTNDDVRKHRITYLLLVVLKTPEHCVTEAEASEHLDSYARESLELNVATARQLWQELANQGLLLRSGSGRTARYTLTPAGRTKLANAEFDMEREFRLRGRTLNALLEAAREIGKQFMPPRGSDIPLNESELQSAVLAGFEELLRESHAVTGMVPIHEVREQVRQRHGDLAGRHDLFDPAVHRLRQSGHFRLVPITDLSKASNDQLQASIPGVGETLFFMETAREAIAR